MKHKVLFISSWLPTKLQPTNGNFVLRHAQAAAKFNHVEILKVEEESTPSGKMSIQAESQNGIKIIRVSYRKTSFPIVNFVCRFRAYIRGYGRLERPHLVHANIAQNPMLFALFLKFRYRIPFVISEHWSGLLPENISQLGYLKRKISRLIYSHSSYFLPVSHRMLESIEKNLSLKLRSEVVGNVVDTALFKSTTRNSDYFTFLHLSSLDENKNPLRILEAFHVVSQRFKQIKLQIGGDGDLIPLLNYVKENCVRNVEVFGFQETAEVAERMASANCFILFSNYENLPCVLLESLACGTPVIATKVGGIAEFVDEHNGILIPPKDALALHTAMAQMITSACNFDEQIMRSKIKNRFSIEQIGWKFTQIYDVVLNEKFH